MNKIYLLYIFFVFSRLANADILFIDLNNVEAEIIVAKAEARKRGEQLIVIPKDRKKYTQNKSHLLSLERQANAAMDRLDACREANRICDQLQAIAQRLSDEYENKAKAIQKFSHTDLQNELNEVVGDVRTVMISGHDGNGNFTGEFGQISAEEFLKVFKQYKGRNNIQSLYLLGCNSAMSHTMGNTWKPSFPNAKFIAGYEGVGYVREDSAGHQFIRNLLSQEKDILNSATMAEALQKFKRIAPRNAAFGGGACFDIKNEPTYLSSHQTSGKLTELLECSKLTDQAKKAMDFHKCVTQKKTDCELVQFDINSMQSQIQNCRFTGNSFDELLKIKSQLYLLSALISPYHSFGFKNIFSNIDPETRRQLNLDENISTFNQATEKLKKLKDVFNEKAEFDSLKNLSIEDLLKFSANKKRIDAAWLGITNLDVERLNYNSQSYTAIAGRLRAQSFYQAVLRKKTTQTFDNRIQELKNLLTNERNYNSKSTLEYEIKELQEASQMYDKLKQSEPTLGPRRQI